MFNTILLILILILAVAAFVLIMFQPSNQQTLSSAFSGGTNLFARSKSHGIAHYLRILTIWCLIGMFILSIIGQLYWTK